MANVKRFSLIISVFLIVYRSCVNDIKSVKNNHRQLVVTDPVPMTQCQ